MDIVIQLIGLGILLVALAVGYRYWVAPHAQTWAQKGLLVLIMLTFWGGFLGGFGWWLDVRESFSWDLPPLASRMLGSAAWSFALLNFLVLRRPTVRRTRLALWMLAVYLVPLAIAIVVLHLYRFDANAPITYAFFAIVIPMSLGAVGYLLRPTTILADEPQDILPTNKLTQIWLAIVGVVSALWGLALFVSADGASDFIWAWRGDLMTSQLIGVMLLTLATGIAYSIRHRDTARLMLWVLTSYGLGLVVAGLWNVLANKPIPLGYVLIFGVIGVGSAVVRRSVRIA